MRIYQLRVTRPAIVLLVLAMVVTMAQPIASQSEARGSLTPVGMTVRSYADTARQNWSGTGDRPLLTMIWYPAVASAPVEPVVVGPVGRAFFRAGAAAADAELSADQERYPLVVISHGTGGAALTLMWLGEHLATNGFIVAAVNHHGNTAIEDQYTAQGFMLWWERAADLSAVIDNLLTDAVFANRIDPVRIGAAGFSLGGYTVLSLAGGITELGAFESFCSGPMRDFTCEPQSEFPDVAAEFARVQDDPMVRNSLARHADSFADERVRAIFSIAPALGGAFTDEGLSPIQIPVSIVVGTADTVTPPATNARRFARTIERADLTEIDGAGHYTFLSECTDDGKQELPSLCVDEQVERNDVHELVKTLALAFFQENL